jgi:hypothetical protein
MTTRTIDDFPTTGRSTSLLLDHPIDRYRIAYLRGGARELLKLRLFELMQMGYLVVYENRRWYGTRQRMGVSPDSPDLQKLPAPDRALLDCFRTPRSEAQIRRMPMPPELRASWPRLRPMRSAAFSIPRS